MKKVFKRTKKLFIFSNVAIKAFKLLKMIFNIWVLPKEYLGKVWAILLVSCGRYRIELTNLLTRKNITPASAYVKTIILNISIS